VANDPSRRQRFELEARIVHRLAWGIRRFGDFSLNWITDWKAGSNSESGGS
jgi:hypothetical protein